MMISIAEVLTLTVSTCFSGYMHLLHNTVPAPTDSSFVNHLGIHLEKLKSGILSYINEYLIVYNGDGSTVCQHTEMNAKDK
jgi:hypothetical protein